jgi:hypothetical protein
MSEQRVGMLRLQSGQRADRALAELDAALPDAVVNPPDELGVFEIVIDAEDQERALQRVWDGIAAAGADEHVVFMEHPDLPEHWRARARRPGEP